MSRLSTTIQVATYTLTTAPSAPIQIASAGHAIMIRRVSEATAQVTAHILRPHTTDPLLMPLRWLEGFRFLPYTELSLSWSAQPYKTVNLVSVVITAEIWTWGTPCEAADRAIEMYGSPLVPAIGT